MNARSWIAWILLGCWPLSGLAGDLAGFATPGTENFTASTPVAALNQDCPEQGGVLDSVAVPAGDSIELVVLTSVPAPEGGATFRLSSNDPAVAAAGDPRQALLPEVHIPEGATSSNPFTVYGLEVGGTQLQAISLTPGFFGFSVPLGTWDVGEQLRQKFLDPNGLVSHCREADDSAELSTDEAVLADCGVTVRGAVTDGTSRLLMRTRSGLAGTACYNIVSDPDHDGSIEVPVKATQQLDELHQASSYYRTPDYFEDTTGFLQTRLLEVEFTFTPSFGNGNTTRMSAHANLIRPPLVLVHGLWSNSGAFRGFWDRDDLFHTTTRADYEANNDAHFVTNVPEVRRAIEEAVAASIERGFATSRVDVIAHSMGGILSRLHVQSDDYARPENFDEGDVRRLVTLATPHLGSTFANLLVALHELRPDETLETVETLIGSGARIDAGAVCDLAENSPALQAFAGGTGVPTHVVSASGGPAGSPDNPADYWGGLLGIGSFERQLTYRECTPTVGPCIPGDFRFPQDVVDGFRFRQGNDAIVPVSSARAGFGAGGGMVQDVDLLHFGLNFGVPLVSGVTNRRFVRNHVFDRLEEPLSTATWAESYPGFGGASHPADGSGEPITVPGIPDPDDEGLNAQVYQLQCVNGPLAEPAAAAMQSAGDPEIEILAPFDGASFTPGDVVAVEVALDPTIEPLDISVMVPGLDQFSGENFDGATYDAGFTIPEGFAGRLEIVPLARAADGTRLRGAAVGLQVVPDDAPESLSLLQRSFRLDVDREQPVRLRAFGQYPDGSERDLSEGVTGTTYSSSSPAVASVDVDGSVEVNGLGNAVITVAHGDASAFALLSVREDYQPLPPVEVTDSISASASGYQLDRHTGFFTQRVSLANSGDLPVFGQLFAVFDGLDDAVRLVNASGRTRQYPGPDLPFANVDLSMDGLHFYPGESDQFVLEYLNPELVPIDFDLRVIQSNLTP